MRALRQSHGIPLKRLAVMFGVSKSTVEAALLGRTWNDGGRIAGVERADCSALSGRRGVSFDPVKKMKPWRARVRVDGKTINLGYYASRQEAAEVVARYRTERAA